MKPRHSKVLMLAVTALFVTIILFVPLNPNQKENDDSLAVKALQKAGVIPAVQHDATIILAGDVMLGRTVLTTSRNAGDPRYPFLKIGDTLWPADIVFVNLENAVIENCPICNECLQFCSDPTSLAGLVYSGINVVNLANNHSKNFGESGFTETQRHLEDKDISFVGNGNLAKLQIGETSFGFVGFDFVSREPTPEDYQLINNYANQADVLIVGVHWGVEYTSEPTEAQRQWAREIVKAGADVISGHHPHWVQISEKVEGKPVYYSLGNLVFDQMWSEETRRGLLVSLQFKDGELINEEFIETFIDQWAQPIVSQNN